MAKEGGMMETGEAGLHLRALRILPKDPADIRPNPRVTIIGEDAMGFTIVEAKLRPEENVCWRCGDIAIDPDHTLEVCPTCGLDFND